MSGLQTGLPVLEAKGYKVLSATLQPFPFEVLLRLQLRWGQQRCETGGLKKPLRRGGELRRPAAAGVHAMIYILEAVPVEAVLKCRVVLRVSQQQSV